MIDLRSDTVTRPTPEMRDAMRAAEVGDDGYADDPTVNRLEQQAAAALGKEAAMLVPTGTMGNLCAVMAQTGRGDAVVLEASAHIYQTEQGGIASLVGVPYRVLPGVRGAIPAAAVEAELAGAAYAIRLRPALLCLETTHNAAGGTVLPLDYLAEVRRIASAHGTSVHIDGARVFNAAVALGVPVAEVARHADTVTFCLSKGLGAPIGSVLCGPAAVIARARPLRKMLGGTMRQAGVIAAAGLVALDRMVDRLADDHRRAKHLATGLAELHPGLCDPAAVETNIVYLDLSASGMGAPEWAAALGQHGVLCRPYSATRIRLLTHVDVGDGDIEMTIQAFRALWPAARSRAA